MKADRPLFPKQDTRHTLPDTSKLDTTTALALQMIEHPSQCLELRRTAFLRTMINVLQMRGTLQMLIQVHWSSEFAVTQIAFIAVPVPCIAGRPGLLVPFEEVVGDEAVGVFLA